MENVIGSQKVDAPKFLRGEMFAYVLANDIVGGTDISVFHLNEWAHEVRDGVIPEKAAKYIAMCEERGSVYSLIGFQVAFNITGDIGEDDYVFFCDLVEV